MGGDETAELCPEVGLSVVGKDDDDTRTWPAYCAREEGDVDPRHEYSTGDYRGDIFCLSDNMLSLSHGKRIVAQEEVHLPCYGGYKMSDHSILRLSLGL